MFNIMVVEDDKNTMRLIMMMYIVESRRHVKSLLNS